MITHSLTTLRSGRVVVESYANVSNLFHTQNKEVKKLINKIKVSFSQAVRRRVALHKNKDSQTLVWCWVINVVYCSNLGLFYATVHQLIDATTLTISLHLIQLSSESSRVSVDGCMVTYRTRRSVLSLCSKEFHFGAWTLTLFIPFLNLNRITPQCWSFKNFYFILFSTIGLVSEIRTAKNNS